MSTALTKYNSKSIARSGNQSFSISPALIVVILGAIVLYFLLKNKNVFAQTTPQTQYTNAEEWDVQYNSDGLPVKIIIHRNATQS